MRSRVLALLVALPGLACVHQQIRAEAAPMLDCQESRISVHEESNPGTFTATGCGRQAVCMVPNVPGAEVQCAGGGPVYTARSY